MLAICLREFTRKDGLELAKPDGTYCKHVRLFKMLGRKIPNKYLLLLIMQATSDHDGGVIECPNQSDVYYNTTFDGQCSRGSFLIIKPISISNRVAQMRS